VRFFARTVLTSDGMLEAELSKLGADGTALWTTVLGAGQHNAAAALVTLSNGDVALAGTTNGALFRPNAAAQEAFVARFSTAGDLLWGLQLSAQVQSYVYGLAVDSEDRLYVCGSTLGSDFNDGFVARVSPDGALDWVTSYGAAAADDLLVDLTVHGDGQVTVVGMTRGSFGTDGLGEEDAFVARIFPDGSLDQVIQYGTPQSDMSRGIAAAPDGAFFVVGNTTGDLEDVDGFGSQDAYVLRVTPF